MLLDFAGLLRFQIQTGSPALMISKTAWYHHTNNNNISILISYIRELNSGSFYYCAFSSHV